jgi:hypothetical protein
MLVPTLSPEHFRTNLEWSAGLVIKLGEMLAASPDRLEAYRKEFDAIVTEYMQATWFGRDI